MCIFESCMGLTLFFDIYYNLMHGLSLSMLATYIRQWDLYADVWSNSGFICP